MSITPPEPGQPLWGDDLNTYLLSLEARIATNEANMASLQNQMNSLNVETDDLTERVIVLEAKPEYVYNSFPWKFSASSPPAGAGELRLDNVDPMLATLIDLRKVDGDGADRAPVFMQLTPGDKVMVSDWDDAAQLHRFTVTGPPMIDATNVQIPVSWVSGNGTLPTAGQAKINVGFLVSLVL